MRRFYSSPEAYDNKLRDHIRMTPQQCASKESHAIWGHFQHKFTLINGMHFKFNMSLDLGKYVGFFKLLLEEILVKCAKQNIYVVELRHIPEMLFDDDRKPLGLKEELSVIDEVLNKVRRDLQLDPSEFHLKLVITGLKIVGRHHIVKMIDSIVDGR